MVLYRLGIFYWCWKNSKILILRPLEANRGKALAHISHHSAKVLNFQHRVWLYSVEQKFHTEVEKTQESWIWARPPKKCALCFRVTRNFLFIFGFLTSYRAAEKLSAWNFRSIEYHHTFYLNFRTLAGLWPWAVVSIVGPAILDPWPKSPGFGS
jgi:hypothetical protein